MGFISKFNTVSWYLRRPRYYPQLFSLVKNRVFGAQKLENTRKESEQWCQERSMTTYNFFQKIAPNLQFKKVEENFPDDFAFAKSKEEASPVKMGGAGNIDLIYNLCEHIQAKKAVETGVAYGWSSLSILLSLEKRNDTLLISTDLPYAKMNNEDFVGCVVPQRLHSKWKLVRDPDRVALDTVLSEIGTLDLCHYDSDKSYAGRMFAYPKIWKALRKGGILISDDIQDNIGFKVFCERIKMEPYIISFENKFVGVMEKN
ncbi:MAG: class I SAM-dependent methyltransferase [Bacteroidetes bacterium]|nr:class I SAM-dependent methyltransferase [Bacteroidota bacterium]MBS1930862.1 class I SAM-dependent methyltransferase [Bacteroidota bacterium]